MEKRIIKLAAKKFSELSTKYDGFITVFLDNWRGYRFIYDTENTNCRKKACKKCPLYQLLKNEKENPEFTAGLYLASPKEKKLFGPQKFLNCKSFSEYQKCYTNFLIQKCRTNKELFSELNLIKKLEIIYSKNGQTNREKLKFKKGIITEALSSLDGKRKKVIQKYLKSTPDFYR